METPENNFIAVRQVGEAGNTLYAEFMTGDMTDGDVDFSKTDFVEYYNVTADPWEMDNLAAAGAAPGVLAERHAALRRWYSCAGASCP